MCAPNGQLSSSVVVLDSGKKIENLTVNDLSVRAGISLPTLRAIEQGEGGGFSRQRCDRAGDGWQCGDLD